MSNHNFVIPLDSPEKELWEADIQEEFQMLNEIGTCAIDRSPPVFRPLPSEVILKLKRDSEGRPESFKARHVARVNLEDEID